jgi:hypothetical protein
VGYGTSRDSYNRAVVLKNLVLGGHSLCIEISINISFHIFKHNELDTEKGRILINIANLCANVILVLSYFCEVS